MANRRPFKIDTPEQTSTFTDGEQALPGKGKFSTLGPGQPLKTPSQEVVEAVGHGHSPRIPWPADKAVEHKPFKNAK
jgi:hypothetical protein